MARTLDEIRASRPIVDRAKVEATTEEDIRRQAIEDGEDPDAEPAFVLKRRPGQRGPSKKGAMVSVTIRIPAEAEARWRTSGEKWREGMRDALVREAPKAKRA